MPALVEMFANSETAETLRSKYFLELKIFSLGRIVWYIGKASDRLGLLARHAEQ